ncbi:MAG: hypothetical protein R2865_14410 [Deinococcales bacterium]
MSIFEASYLILDPLWDHTLQAWRAKPDGAEAIIKVYNDYLCPKVKAQRQHPRL